MTFAERLLAAVALADKVLADRSSSRVTLTELADALDAFNLVTISEGMPGAEGERLFHKLEEQKAAIHDRIMRPLPGDQN